jgi:hypothetical protein
MALVSPSFLGVEVSMKTFIKIAIPVLFAFGCGGEPPVAEAPAPAVVQAQSIAQRPAPNPARPNPGAQDEPDHNCDTCVQNPEAQMPGAPHERAQ